MKTQKEQFVQHLSHDIEDEEESELYLDKCLPLIGYITMWFNGLEKSLDNIICQIFTDRTDSTGLIVLHKMTYSAKVDLLKRFSDDFHSCFEETIDDERRERQLCHGRGLGRRLRAGRRARVLELARYGHDGAGGWGEEYCDRGGYLRVHEPYDCHRDNPQSGGRS